MKVIVSTTSSCFGPCHVSVVVRQCSREVFTSRVNHHKHLVSTLMSIHVHLIHQITSLCMFHVIDGGYVKALLRQVYSCRLQHIIQELDLETS
jgi:hypothetical protein